MTENDVDYLAGGDCIEVHSPEFSNVDEKVTKSTEVIDKTPETPVTVLQKTENVEDFQASLETCDSKESCLSSLQSVESIQRSRTSNSITEARKYKFDDLFLQFIEAFTAYCEDKRSLIFNADMLIDDSYFPRQLLNEYVPINVVCSNVTDFTFQLSPPEDHCPLKSCSDGFYEYFTDYQPVIRLEMILRDHVMFVLNSLQCKKLTSFSLECTTWGDSTGDKNNSLDRMLTWNHSISRFLSNHRKNLEKIEIKAVRSKSLNASNENDSAAPLPPNQSSVCQTPSFPKLVELTVIFWNTVNKPKNQGGSTTWTPDWFPDPVDHYWITLVKSQLHGRLRKLIWISAANLNWNDVFQPVIDANENTLEVLHIQDIQKRNAIANLPGGEENDNDNACSCCCITSTVLSCNAFKKLKNLKDLYLRKANCCLVDLQMLPTSLEELCIDDITLESKEIMYLESLPSLKVLRLIDNILPVTMKSHLPSSDFGVDKAVLSVLLHCRNLHELCIWGHRVHANNNASISQGNGQDQAQLRSAISIALANINSYLKNVFNNSEIGLSKLLTTQMDLNLNDPVQDHAKIKRLEETINKKLGFMDSACIVIHAERI